MPYNYADQFSQVLDEKYRKELTCDALYRSNPGVQFINAKTIKLPVVSTSGYKDHTRTQGFNAGTLSNSWEAKVLGHDRDIEFFIDPMDIDETNLALSVANITSTFEEEHAIPERDCYTYSKLFADAVALSTSFHGTLDTTALTAANVLAKFDAFMEAMDEAGVPEEGRLLYVTPAVHTLIKQSQAINREISVGGGALGINRLVHSLDDVELKRVPSARLKTAYNYTDGCVPLAPTSSVAGAGQMHMMLVHPSCVVARNKHDYIKLFEPGSDSRTGDGYIYQNRAYWDAFLLNQKTEGLAISYTAGTTSS